MKHKPFAPGSPLRPDGPGGPTGNLIGPGKPIDNRTQKHISIFFFSRKNNLPGTPAAPLAPGTPTINVNK